MPGKLSKAARRKYFSRSNVAVSLRTAVNELQNTIQLAEKPPEETPLVASLKKVLRSINQAIEWEKNFQLGRKRIAGHLVRERKNLEDLIQEVVGIPVTHDEKVTAKNSRKKGA